MTAPNDRGNPLLQPLDLTRELPAPTLDAWRAEAEASLKGRPLAKLRASSLDGLVVEPLYTAADGEPRPGVPGRAPFLRGRTTAPAAWQRCELVDDTHLASARARLASARRLGADAVWLRLTTPGGGDGVPVTTAADLAVLLADLDLAHLALHLDPGGAHLAVTAALAVAVERAGGRLETLTGSLGCDPLATLARSGHLPTGLVAGLGQLVAVTRWAAEHAPRMAPITASAASYHRGGATPVQEVAFAVATGLEYLRALHAAAVDGERVPAPRLVFAIGRDVFTEIAKLRAARAVWAKAAAACGVGAAGAAAAIHAVTSERTVSRRDPWVNLLRATTQTFAAAVGGADTISTLPFDRAWGDPSDLARRLTLNTQHILAEESHLDHVVDPAGGSWYVERLTDQLAARAWELLATIERDGGMADWLLTGKAAAAVEQVAAERGKAIATRRWPITGVSSYPLLDEKTPPRPAAPRSTAPPRPRDVAAATDELVAEFARSGFTAALVERAIATVGAGAELAQISTALNIGAPPAAVAAIPPRPEAAPFELLRDRSDRCLEATGKRPAMFLANLGPLAEHKPRAGFASSLVEAAGVAALGNDGFATPADAAAAFAASGARAAVICSSDERYAAEAAAAAAALKAAGAELVWLAGRPGEHEAAWRAAGVDGFVYLGCDVVAALGGLLDRLLGRVEVHHG